VVAVFGFVPQLNAFFITMIVCVGSSSFPVRTFGQWNNIWMRDRLGGRDLKAYFFSQVLDSLSCEHLREASNPSSLCCGGR
jgi:hypothetical protein